MEKLTKNLSLDILVMEFADNRDVRDWPEPVTIATLPARRSRHCVRPRPGVRWSPSFMSRLNLLAGRFLCPPQKQCRRVGFSLASPSLRANQDEWSNFVHDGSGPDVSRCGPNRRDRYVVDAV